MEQYNIVIGFLSDPLDDVFEWQDAAPPRFLASPFLCEPSDLDLAELRRLYEAGRLGGLGEVGSQYCGLAIDDPSLEPYFAMAAEFDVPVLVHSHGTGAPSGRFRISIGRPTRIEEVLVRHPTLRVYIENSGFPFFEDTVALMYRYPNVYGDLSNITWMKPRTMFYRYLRGLMEASLGKRLMFGSDQMQWPEVIGEAIEAIESAPFLSADERRDILYNNAARFLRLTEQDDRRSPCS
jgi:predicted TIM-barrel fold metal-dependent hydrolase